MRTELVEIYSDATNAAVLRHPGRKFPGILLQGDTLWTMYRKAEDACQEARPVLDQESYLELEELRNSLRQLLTHYKKVLGEHGIPLPFVESSQGD